MKTIIELGNIPYYSNREVASKSRTTTHPFPPSLLSIRSHGKILSRRIELCNALIALNIVDRSSKSSNGFEMNTNHHR